MLRGSPNDEEKGLEFHGRSGIRGGRLSCCEILVRHERGPMERHVLSGRLEQHGRSGRLEHCGLRGLEQRGLRGLEQP